VLLVISEHVPIVFWYGWAIDRLEDTQRGVGPTGLGSVFTLWDSGNGREGDIAFAHNDFLSVFDPIKELAEVVF
jgi:hypothetical protein